MKKFFKRFGAIAFAIALCFTMNTVSMAAEVAESVGTVSTVAEDGSVVFTLMKHGNGTALNGSGFESFRTGSSTPNRVLYIVQTTGGANPWCDITIDNQQGTLSLTCDGRSHVAKLGPAREDDVEWSLGANRTYTCRYRGSNLVSISMVFYRE